MENLPEQEKGTSRDIAANKLGMSGKTAEKALKVVKVADEMAKVDPAKAQDIKDTLNNVSVNAAVKKVMTEQEKIDIHNAEVDEQKKKEKKSYRIIKFLHTLNNDEMGIAIKEAFRIRTQKYSMTISSSERKSIISTMISGTALDNPEDKSALMKIKKEVEEKISQMDSCEKRGGLTNA